KLDQRVGGCEEDPFRRTLTATAPLGCAENVTAPSEAPLTMSRRLERCRFEGLRKVYVRRERRRRVPRGPDVRVDQVAASPSRARPRSDPQRPSARTHVKDAAPEGVTENGGQCKRVCLGDVTEVPVDDRVADDRRTLTLVA